MDEAASLRALIPHRCLPLTEIDAGWEVLGRKQADRPEKDSTSETSGFHERFENRGFNDSDDLNYGKFKKFAQFGLFATGSRNSHTSAVTFV